MPTPSRPASSVEITQALLRLFTALPPRRGKFDDLIDGYEMALRGVDIDALDVAVRKIVRGEVEEISAVFAPSPAELARACRSIEQKIGKLHQLAALPLYEPMPFVGLEMRMAAAHRKQIADGRTLLFTVDSQAEARTRAKECPPGSIYSGILGAFYGPVETP